MNTAELSEKSLLCSICNKYLTQDNFYINDRRCKRCQASDKAKKYQIAKKTPKKRITRKRCQNCKELKGSTKFPIHVISEDGRSNTCWKCKNKIQNDLQNPDKFWWRKAVVQNRYKIGRITAQQLKTLYEIQKQRCHYCKCLLNSSEVINVDHAIPRSKGGNGEIDNLRITCPDCNRLKHDKTEEDFINFLMEYAKRVMIIRTEESK
jgi:5-methylcytosine-specific restriction endonuclease McrA